MLGAKRKSLGAAPYSLPLGPLVRFRVEFTAQFTLFKRRNRLEAPYMRC